MFSEVQYVQEKPSPIIIPGLRQPEKAVLLQSSLANCLDATDAEEAQQVMHLARAPQPLHLATSILTDDPLAPLGPGGPCGEENTDRSQEVF